MHVVQEYLKILQQGKDETTEEILTQLANKFKDTSQDDIFAEVKRIYAAMRESGQILLRKKHVTKFKKSGQHLKLYKIECESCIKK